MHLITFADAFGSTQTLTMDHRNLVTADCKANSSEQCNYQWIHIDTNAVISSSETLTTDEAGQYRCKATCMLRDQICEVIGLSLIVNMATQEGVHTNHLSFNF